ncbi:MAG: pyruvate, water dikinase regulatory protein [Candidatus Methylomirabilota bacterium]
MMQKKNGRTGVGKPVSVEARRGRVGSMAPKRRRVAAPLAMRGRDIFIASDATGRTAELVVKAALVQFRGAQVRLTLHSQVRTAGEVREIVQAAADVGGLVVHTMVLPELRTLMLTETRAHHVPTIDLLGPLLLRLEDLLELEPVRQPGLFRQQDEEYRRRFEVMDFTVRHDDGQDPADLPTADIVLVGVSRSSKTPLSMFLAWRGHRTANVPIVYQLPLPEELARVDPRKVVGLTISADRLLELRRSRLQQMATPPQFSYADPRQILAELDYARTLCGRAGWPQVDVTDKSVEEVASEVLILIGAERAPGTSSGKTAPRVPAWRRTSE